jgi:hypothetical protein
MLFRITFRPLQPVSRFMSHDLGNFPAHVELANPRRVVGLAKFVADGCNVGLPWEIGCSQAQAAKAKETEEQEPSPSPAGGRLCRKMHRLRFGKSLVLASDSALDSLIVSSGLRDGWRAGGP